MRSWLACLLIGFAALAPAENRAADFTIGYLQLERDARYGSKRLYARYPGQALGRPYSGAEVALGEIKFHGAAVGAQFKLARFRGKVKRRSMPRG